MIRYLLFLGFVSLSTSAGFAQCIASLDAKQRVITTCQLPYSDIRNPIKLPRGQATYLGSEYVSFPFWQPGTLKLGASNREVSCKISYNLVTQEVKCQLDTTASQETTVMPDAFTINGVDFIRYANQPNSAAPAFYGTVLYAGPTKLLKKMQRKLQMTEPVDGYNKAEEFNGYYETLTSYFIQKEDKRLIPVSLTKKSILAALSDRSDQVSAKLTAKKISVDELVNVLKHYDSQVAN